MSDHSQSPSKASDLLVAALEAEGVEYIFAVPGEENLDVLESLRTSKIELVLNRHEQGAAFMAATYGRLTGKAGVCMATLGPGATNFATPCCLCASGWNAVDHDHRPKAHQEIETRPVSDRRYRRFVRSDLQDVETDCAWQHDPVIDPRSLPRCAGKSALVPFCWSCPKTSLPKKPLNTFLSLIRVTMLWRAIRF